GGLPSEPNNSNISDDRLAQAGLDSDAINFLRSQRVELNAMTSRQLIDFVENKLKQHGIEKVIPDGETLARTYKLFAASHRLCEAFDEVKEELKEENDEAAITVPEDLEEKVTAKLKEKREITWHRAIELIVDPDASESKDDENDDGEEDDED